MINRLVDIMNTKMRFDVKSPLYEPVKPIVDIEKIIQTVSPFADMLFVEKGQILRYSVAQKRVCYLLHSGSVTLNRRGDGMVLNSERAPFILGVSNQAASASNLYIKVTDNAHVSRLNVERFNLLIASEDLWKNVCYLLVYNASRVFEHCTRISQMSSYDIIKFQLQELANEPDRVRLNITAANYIRNRTYLSRSGIMNILSRLRDGEHVTLDRGVLLKINKLPDTL